MPSPGPGALWSTSLQTSSFLAPFKSLQYKTNHHASHLTSQIGNKRLLFPSEGWGLHLEQCNHHVNLFKTYECVFGFS